MANNAFRVPGSRNPEDVRVCEHGARIMGSQPGWLALGPIQSPGTAPVVTGLSSGGGLGASSGTPAFREAAARLTKPPDPEMLATLVARASRSHAM